MQHWQRLTPNGPERPGGRWGHAAMSITQSQLGIQGNLLLLVGGVHNNDGWICDLENVKWMKVSVACRWAVMHVLTHNTRLS